MDTESRLKALLSFTQSDDRVCPGLWSGKPFGNRSLARSEHRRGLRHSRRSCFLRGTARQTKRRPCAFVSTSYGPLSTALSTQPIVTCALCPWRLGITPILASPTISPGFRTRRVGFESGLAGMRGHSRRSRSGDVGSRISAVENYTVLRISRVLRCTAPSTRQRWRILTAQSARSDG